MCQRERPKCKNWGGGGGVLSAFGRFNQWGGGGGLRVQSTQPVGLASYPDHFPRSGDVIHLQLWE